MYILYMYLGGNKMEITNLHDLIKFMLMISLALGAGYTRGQSNGWKEWLNGFFE